MKNKLKVEKFGSFLMKLILVILWDFLQKFFVKEVFMDNPQMKDLFLLQLVTHIDPQEMRIRIIF